MIKLKYVSILLCFWAKLGLAQAVWAEVNFNNDKFMTPENEEISFVLVSEDRNWLSTNLDKYKLAASEIAFANSFNISIDDQRPIALVTFIPTKKELPAILSQLLVSWRLNYILWNGKKVVSKEDFEKIK